MAAANKTEAARRRRDEGIVRSILHADHESAHWPELAFIHLVKYAATNNQPWTVEEAREWCYDHKLPEPPDHRAWGGVVQRAIRHRIIKRHGFGRTNSSNRSFMPRYIGNVWGA